MAASLKLLAEFFHGAATQLEAGLGIQEVLDAQALALRRGRFAREMQRWREIVARGGAWSEGLAQSGSYLPPGTAAIIGAGERTGRLGGCCKLLAQDFEDRIKLSRALLAVSWYPLLVLFVALGVAGLMLYLNPMGKMQAQLHNKPGGQAAVAAESEHRAELFVWAVVAIGVVGAGGLIGWRQIMPQYWYGLMPLNPRLAWRQSSMQFFRTWHLGAAAGLLADQALDVAAESIHHPNYRKLIHAVADGVRAKHIPPSQLLGPSGFVDTVELQQIVTMEKTGNVEDTLGRLADHAGDRFRRGMKLWVGFVVGLLVVGVLGFVIWQIISFFLGYVGMWDMKNYR